MSASEIYFRNDKEVATGLQDFVYENNEPF